MNITITKTATGSDNTGPIEGQAPMAELGELFILNSRGDIIENNEFTDLNEKVNEFTTSPDTSELVLSDEYAAGHLVATVETQPSTLIWKYNEIRLTGGQHNQQFKTTLADRELSMLIATTAVVTSIAGGGGAHNG